MGGARRPLQTDKVGCLPCAATSTASTASIATAAAACGRTGQESAQHSLRTNSLAAS